MFYEFLFLFTDTATTEIYTYGHTLFLHDALPILSDRRLAGTQAPGFALVGRRASRNAGANVLGGEIKGEASAAGRGRSEEHTSELQSLMRISYAVFCLKKKKQTSKQ